MIRVRQARREDVRAIRELFLASYGTDYSPRFYDEAYLTSLVHCRESLLLVAEDPATGQGVGTVAVDFEEGAGANLVGQFRRLAVLPAYRQSGVGHMLMNELMGRVRDRIQVGLVEARGLQAHAIRIAESYGFATVGFLPLKLVLRESESFVMLVRHFGNTLELRKARPRVIPAVHPLAQLALRNCGLAADAVRDDCEVAPAARANGSFVVRCLSAEERAAVFESESGRLNGSKDAVYLAAHHEGRIAGVVGFTVDPRHGAARIFEMTVPDWGEEAVAVLLGAGERMWRANLGGAPRVVEIEVSAHAPRIQRTLKELGFAPVAYIPALAPAGLERVDVVKMFRLAGPVRISTEALTLQSRAVADLVLTGFATAD